MRKLLFLIAVFIFFIQPCFAIKIGLQTDVNKTYIGPERETRKGERKESIKSNAKGDLAIGVAFYIGNI